VQVVPSLLGRDQDTKTQSMVLEGSIMTDLILRDYKVNDIAYKRSPKRIP